ncbi:MAG: IS110 family transposase [Acholeplasmataceae bacterium]|jgi:transposase
MYLVGIDISKYKHDCFIATETGCVIQKNLSFLNSKEGFNQLKKLLQSLDSSQVMRIGLEATGHYGFNLKMFLEKNGFSFMEFNPLLTHKFSEAQSLRKTKTDPLDAKSIAMLLLSVEYKTYPPQSYHMFFLKSLSRLRSSLVKQRSKHLVQLTNTLDYLFPEFKPFFHYKFSGTALFLLEKFSSPLKMSRMNLAHYESLRTLSRGHFSYASFIQLKALAQNTVGSSDSILLIELSSILHLFKSVNLEIKNIELQIQLLIADIPSPILSIPGVGVISAASILSEFGYIPRFDSPAQMLSFAGMDPAIYQSGTVSKNGRMVKRGSGYLRATLFKVAEYSLIWNPIFYDYYKKKRSEGKSHLVALSHLARKLVRLIFTLETKQIKFDLALLR